MIYILYYIMKAGAGEFEKTIVFNSYFLENSKKHFKFYGILFEKH